MGLGQMGLARLAAVLAAAVLLAIAVAGNSNSAGRMRPGRLGKSTVRLSAATAGKGIHKIRHVVIIIQENRSFDSYFGTYPQADPKTDGRSDPRPDVRENERVLGNLTKDFDFKQNHASP